MVTLTDANGHLAVQNTLDTAGRVVEQRDAMSALTCIYYGRAPAYTSASCPGVSPAPTSTQTIMVDPRGGKTKYAFDVANETSQVTNPIGGTVTYSYDGNRNATCVTDELGHKTSSSYDTHGNLVQMIDAASTDGNCGLLSTGPKYGTTTVGSSTGSIATNRTEAKKVVLPPGTVTALSAYYKYVGPSAAATAKLALYGDVSGAPGGPPLASCSTTMQLAVSQWVTCTISYSAASGTYWLAYMDTLNGNYQYVYTTGTGLLGYHCADTSATFPNNPFPNVAANCDGGEAWDRSAYATMATGKWTYTYDQFNDMLTKTDPIGRVTTSTYNANGDLTSVTNALGQTATFVVNADGTVSSLTDPQSHTTSFGYDAYGNSTSRRGSAWPRCDDYIRSRRTEANGHRPPRSHHDKRVRRTEQRASRHGRACPYNDVRVRLEWPTDERH